ncbi:MAG: homocysteine S-methyltransferase family protein [Oscillospiraceae bacterium]|nr:homocysteine S-methyltransferase family protein [Oscillospiraceae bacterium]
MDFKDLLKTKTVIFDGGLGTMLQSSGTAMNEIPETLNLAAPEKVYAVHKAYVDAGADVISANTFGANAIKLKSGQSYVDEVIKAAVTNARKAAETAGKKVFTALDMGSTGRLLKPLGDLSFDEAYDAFKQAATAGEKYGAELAIIETVTDTLEMKAAVLAVAENTSLPVAASFSFDQNGRLLTGGDIGAAVTLLNSLPVTILGLNCGLGPDAAEKSVDKILEMSDFPVIVQPNAGLPVTENGVTVYGSDAEEFADKMAGFVKKGVSAVGGCCGTTPEDIRLAALKCRDIMKAERKKSGRVYISSYMKAVEMADKAGFNNVISANSQNVKNALLAKDYYALLDEALSLQDGGAEAIAVDLRLDGADESESYKGIFEVFPPFVTAPLVFMTENAGVIKFIDRYYNGKTVIYGEI